MIFPRLFGHRSRQRTGLLLAFGSLMWLGTYSALAKGLTPFLSPVTLLVLSELLTAAFIVLTFGLFPLLREFARLTRKEVAIAIGIGLLNSAIAPLLWFKGLQQTTAINASMLSTGDVAAALLFGYVLLGERINRMQKIGVTVIIAGILVVNLGGADAASFGLHYGDTLILLATQVFGLGAVLFKKYLSHVMPELAIAIRSLVASITVLCISLCVGSSFLVEVGNFPLEKVALLLAFSFFSRFLSLTMYYESLDRLPVTTLELIQAASPLSGLVFATIILGESVQYYHVLGGSLLVCGLLLEQTSGRMWSSGFRTLLKSAMPQVSPPSNPRLQPSWSAGPLPAQRR